MKKIITLSLLIISISVSAQSFKSKPYKTGNYIFCGNELPKHFSYLIERKSDASEWTAVAKLNFPKNSVDCESSLLSLPNTISAITNVTKAQAEKIWKLSQKASLLDSLYAYAFDPRYQFALGCAWFDEGITKAGAYQYRIYRLSQSGEKLLVNEVKCTFPGNPYSGALRAVNFKLNTSSIAIIYNLSDSVNTAGVKIYRSLYKQNKFSEIPVTAIFTRFNGKISVQISDESASKGITYSYLAVAYDGLGNMGKQTTDTLNIYNMSKPSDIGIIDNFEATPNMEKRGVQLKWKLKNSLYVTSIEIFRSATYDGKYIKIASVGSYEFEYFDNNKITPATAYYYYIVINSGYGTSLPSARVPAILKGNKQNFFPPQNLTASRNSNIVTLSFKRLGNDIHSYYIYRANGYVDELHLLPRMLISKDTMLTYNDTLPLTSIPAVYSYAVASVNTSYNISPITERVNIKYSGGMLPIPSKVNVMMQNKSILLVWNNVSEDNAAVSAYQVFRTVTDENGKSEALKSIAQCSYEQNHFTDTAIVAGMHYRYSIRCIGLDKSDTSSLSASVGITVAEQLPLQPGSLSALASEKKILLQWDIPSDNSINAYRIYRAVAGEKPTILKELPSDTNQYEDSSVKSTQTYFYYIVSVNNSGKEGRPTDEVSAKLK